MKRILTIFAAALAGALATLLVISLAVPALAQGGPPAPATGRAQMGGGQMGSGQMGGGQMGSGQMGGRSQSLVAMAAAKLGLNQAELIAQLGDDGTIIAALDAGGVNVPAFIDEFVASRAKRLDAAVAAGSLTRAEADARLELARSMSAARLAQPFTTLGPGGQGPNAGQGQGQGQGQGFVDADGDGVCDGQPSGGQGQRGGGHGPRR